MKYDKNLNYSKLEDGAQEYEYLKTEFLRKHVLDHICTSNIENDSWHKEYICEDGAIWYESCGAEYATVPLSGSFKSIKISTCVEIKLFKVEYWNSKDAKSKYFYEIY